MSQFLCFVAYSVPEWHIILATWQHITLKTSTSTSLSRVFNFLWYLWRSGKSYFIRDWVVKKLRHFSSPPSQKKIMCLFSVTLIPGTKYVAILTLLHLEKSATVVKLWMFTSFGKCCYCRKSWLNAAVLMSISVRAVSIVIPIATYLVSGIKSPEIVCFIMSW